MARYAFLLGSAALMPWACNGTLPLGVSDAGDSGSDVEADVTPPDAGLDVTNQTDATPDVVLRTANEWILPVDMDGDPQALASDSEGNVIITGQSNSQTLFFTKLDPHGNVIWDKVFAGGALGSGLAVDSTDDVILTGLGFGASFNVGGATLGSGSFIAKFAPDGALVWSKSLVPGSSDRGPRVALAASDALIATGTCSGTVNVAGGQAMSQGGVYAVKLTSDDSVAWSKSLGGNNPPQAIASDGAGGAVFVGTGLVCGSTGSQFVAHVDGSGTCTAVSIGDYYSSPGAISVDSAGNSFVLLQTIPQSSVCAGDFAFILAKLDSSLATLWTKCIQGGTYPQAQGGGLLADDAGNVVVTGAASGAPDASIDLGGGSITSSNAFLVRYAPDGGYKSETLWPASTNILPYLLAAAPSPTSMCSASPAARRSPSVTPA